MRPTQVLPVRVSVDLGVMRMKGYLTLYKISRTEISLSVAILCCTRVQSLFQGVCFTLMKRIQSAYYIFTNPSARAGYDTRSIFQQSLTGLNSEFSLTKAE